MSPIIPFWLRDLANLYWKETMSADIVTAVVGLGLISFVAANEAVKAQVFKLLLWDLFKLPSFIYKLFVACHVGFWGCVFDYPRTSKWHTTHSAVQIFEIQCQGNSQNTCSLEGAAWFLIFFVDQLLLHNIDFTGVLTGIGCSCLLQCLETWLSLKLYKLILSIIISVLFVGNFLGKYEKTQRSRNCSVIYQFGMNTE